jgi:ABC-2 type transport system permease protein
MNLALWKKALSDSWRQLLASAILLVAFSWLFVWLMSLMPPMRWGALLRLLPGRFQPLWGVPLDLIATPLGQLSILYVHVITLLVCVGWALGRGSDPVSGEITRGTMDLILSLPVRRMTVLVVPAIVASVGAALLVDSVLLGIALGLGTTSFPEEVPLAQFLPGAVNLFAMTFCLMGIAMLVSTFVRDRWRTISIGAGFFIVSLIIEIVARMWEAGAWLGYLSFLSAFQPQRLILMHAETATLGLRYNMTLVGLGLASYAAAVVVFSYRDVPASR